MSKQRRSRGSKYDDDFKRQLVAESRADGLSVAMVSKGHGVATNRIYAWRSNARVQPDGSESDAFAPVEVTDVGAVDTLSSPIYPTLPALRIETTRENGRRLVVSDGVDAGFVLELALGLAA